MAIFVAIIVAVPWAVRQWKERWLSLVPGGVSNQDGERRLRIEPDPAWAGPEDFHLRLDDSFEFQLGLGSGLHGLNLVKIFADGTASYVYETAGGWNRKSFSVPRRDVERLVEKVNALRVFGLAQVYSDPNIEDGAQWCLLIKTGGRKKRVYCNNYFPGELQELAEFVHRMVVQPAAAQARGMPISLEELRQNEKEVWALRD